MVSPVLRLKTALQVLRCWREYGVDPTLYVRQWLFHRNTNAIELRDGTSLVGGPDEPLLRIFLEVWGWQTYNPPGFEIDQDDVVVDIGANVGVFSLFAARRTRNRVIAVEAYGPNFEFLVANMERNGATNVSCHHLAIGNEIGPVSLFHSSNDGGHLLFDHNAIEGRLTESSTVDGTTLSSLLEENKIRRVSFLKLDCEGAEFPILLNAPGSTLQRIDRMAMEYHDEVTDHGHEELVDRLRCGGFEVSASPSKGGGPFGHIWAKRP